MTEEDTRTYWSVVTNTDLTEGRGYPISIGICSLEATAFRLARGKGVMGSDAEVLPTRAIKVNGIWYLPVFGVPMISSSAEDKAAQKALDAKRDAIKKAEAAGLTAEDIQAIKGGAV